MTHDREGRREELELDAVLSASASSSLSSSSRTIPSSS
jgi:hypothetical protein